MKTPKRLIASFMLACSLLVAGCTTETSLGPCVGLDSEGENAGLIYSLSARNIILAIIFSETIVVPVIVVVDEVKCPTARRMEAK